MDGEESLQKRYTRKQERNKNNLTIESFLSIQGQVQVCGFGYSYGFGYRYGWIAASLCVGDKDVLVPIPLAISISHNSHRRLHEGIRAEDNLHVR